MSVAYYKIHDLNLVGKKDNHVPYLFKNGKWELDEEHIIDDRRIGYDEVERTLGNSDMLDEIDEITEEEAMAIIAKG